MPTKKQQSALKRAFARGKKQGKVREERHAVGLLSTAVAVLLFLLLAQHNGWWPYQRPKLGSAFFTNVSASTPAPAAASTSSGSGSTGTSNSGTGSTGSAGSGNSGTTAGGGSSTGSGSTGTAPIANFAAGLNIGDSEAQTSTQANGLNQNCALVVGANATDAGQQQVCTYSEGNKIVTVTYLNNHVVSASKSGF
jgi:hypothetical protein